MSREFINVVWAGPVVLYEDMDLRGLVEDVPGTYVVFSRDNAWDFGDEENEIQYIGTAKNVRQGLEDHASSDARKGDPDVKRELRAHAEAREAMGAWVAYFDVYEDVADNEQLAACAEAELLKAFMNRFGELPEGNQVDGSYKGSEFPGELVDDYEFGDELWAVIDWHVN